MPAARITLQPKCRTFMSAISVACRTVLTGVAMHAVLSVLQSTTVLAQTYPTKPVRIIVPYGPGGIADVTMRLTAENLSRKFGQQFYIENKPGAGGIVGMQAAAQSPADGYTLVMIGGGLTIARALFKDLPYDLEKDFTPISTTASYGIVIVTRAGSKFKTVQEVIAQAKAHPGTVNFGTINAGSAQNLSAELFRMMAGIDATIIPYRTTPDLTNAVLRGDVDLAFEYYVGFQSLIQANQVAVVATTGKDRASNLPDAPTASESGLASYEVTSWNGLAVRKGTPAEIVTTLNRAVEEALQAPDIQKFSREAGMDARGMSPEALQARIADDVAKWSRVIDQMGIAKR